jgi:hypothetical protein
VRCWVCGATSEAICRFCGRAICKLHARSHPYLFQVWRTASGLRALATDDAIWCGVCRPRAEPIAAEFLDSSESPVDAGPDG